MCEMGFAVCALCHRVYLHERLIEMKEETRRMSRLMKFINVPMETDKSLHCIV